MNKATRSMMMLMAVAMLAAPVSLRAQSAQQTMNGRSAVSDWNTPPPGTEQAQQGYRDGVEAAQLDKTAKRKVDPHTSYLYQHPPVKKGPARDAYLSAFEQGYKAAVEHGSGM